MDSSASSGIDHATDSVDHNRQDKDCGGRGVDVGVAVAVQALTHQIAQQGAQDAEEHAQQSARRAPGGNAGHGGQPGGQENVMGRGRGEAGLGEDQRDSRKAEAHDREDAERGGKLILVQERGDEAHHNADAAAQYHVIDEALPGGKPLALSGAGVLAGQAGLAEGQTGDNRQNEDGDAGQVGGGGAGAADDEGFLSLQCFR